MFYKDRVQVLNPRTKRWVLINTAAGGIIGHKSDSKPYKNVMTHIFLVSRLISIPKIQMMENV